MLVEGLSKVSKIECSKNSSFAILGGSLYSWGSNKHGILGQTSNTKNVKHQYHPEKVLFPSTDTLLTISAGGNHIAALIQRKEVE
jgi:alpha-tubulin suppressor-like RCC1 family protein